MQIRVLTPPDAPSFIALRLRGLRECPAAFASSYEEEVAMPLSEIEARLEPKDGSAIFGAFHNSHLSAVVGLQRENMAKLAHKAYIWGMYVAPEVRTRGIGAKILSHALLHASTVMRVKQINLGVNTNNTAAVGLYRKLGFVQYGLERGFLLVGGVLHDEYQMVCHVASAV